MTNEELIKKLAEEIQNIMTQAHLEIGRREGKIEMLLKTSEEYKLKEIIGTVKEEEKKKAPATKGEIKE